MSSENPSVEKAAATTDGSDEVMSVTYGIPKETQPVSSDDACVVATPDGSGAMAATPGESAPYDTTTPGGVASVPCTADGRKLVFIGVRNVVICRDMTDPANIVEVWRHEMGGIAALHFCETSVVFSGGVVVARYLKDFVGLDPATGEVRWKTQLKDGGFKDFVTIVPSPFVVYIGTHNYVTALSAVNGQVLWVYDFGHFFTVLLPTICVCGPCIFAAGGDEAVYLNAADGSLIWKADFSSKTRARPFTAAWDGANRVLLGNMGYVYRFNLKDGSQEERINLKGTGYNTVNLTYDKTRKVFYALSGGKLYAISDGDDNHIVWECETPHGFVGSMYCSLGLEPVSGTIYVAHAGRFFGVSTDGKILFKTEFTEPMLSDYSYALTVDVQNTGMIYLGASGSCTIFDSQGKVVQSDDLPGMRFGLTTLCTQTASVDPNASAQVINKFIIISKNNKH